MKIDREDMLELTRRMTSAHRTDRADQEAVHFFRLPLTRLVLSLDRNVVIPVKHIDAVGMVRVSAG